MFLFLLKFVLKFTLKHYKRFQESPRLQPPVQFLEQYNWKRMFKRFCISSDELSIRYTFTLVFVHLYWCWNWLPMKVKYWTSYITLTSCSKDKFLSSIIEMNLLKYTLGIPLVFHVIHIYVDVFYWLSTGLIKIRRYAYSSFVWSFWLLISCFWCQCAALLLLVI